MIISFASPVLSAVIGHSLWAACNICISTLSSVVCSSCLQGQSTRCDCAIVARPPRRSSRSSASAMRTVSKGKSAVDVAAPATWVVCFICVHDRVTCSGRHQSQTGERAIAHRRSTSSTGLGERIAAAKWAHCLQAAHVPCWQRQTC